MPRSAARFRLSATDKQDASGNQSRGDWSHHRTARRGAPVSDQYPANPGLLTADYADNADKLPAPNAFIRPIRVIRGEKFLFPERMNRNASTPLMRRRGAIFGVRAPHSRLTSPCLANEARPRKNPCP